MSVKRSATHISVLITDEHDKRFELRGIPLDTATEDMMTILRVITVCDFVKPIVFDLPAAWYDHMPFVTRITVHNDDDNLVFTLYYGDTNYQYTVRGKDFLDEFDLSVKWDEYEYNSTPVVVEGLEGIHYHWTQDTEEILITDRKSFALLVDRYDNQSIDSFWRLALKEVYTECALLDKEEINKLRELLPVEINKALVDNVFYGATQRYE